MLRRLAEASLTIAIEKCQFFQKEIKYLGHILSAEGISADPANVQAVLAWDSPKSPKQIKQFLGAVAYYRRFMLPGSGKPNRKHPFRTSELHLLSIH